MKFPRGALLNFATVFAGALVGLLVGSALPERLKIVALSGLGLVTVGMSIKMFLQARNLLAVAAAVALGGVLGSAIGIDAGLQSFAEFMRQRTGGGDAAQFNTALVATSVLFCVGPMTLLGCIEDALENRLNLISVKSTMDGIAAVFFAAASRSAGLGVLTTAFVVLVVQTVLTLAARALKPLADDEELMAEFTGTGGALLMGTGLGLLQIKSLPVADYLPALVLAPLFVSLGRRRTRKMNDQEQG